MSNKESGKNQKNGRGRPAKIEALNHQTVFRYGDSHDHYLKSLSDSMGKSQSDVLRIALTAYYNSMRGIMDLE